MECSGWTYCDRAVFTPASGRSNGERFSGIYISLCLLSIRCRVRQQLGVGKADGRARRNESDGANSGDRQLRILGKGLEQGREGGRG